VVVEIQTATRSLEDWRQTDTAAAAADGDDEALKPRRHHHDLSTSSIVSG